MAKALITESTLTAIADAIRTKTGSTATMTPSQMPEQIAAIETGGGVEPGPMSPTEQLQFIITQSEHQTITASVECKPRQVLAASKIIPATDDQIVDVSFGEVIPYIQADSGWTAGGLRWRQKERYNTQWSSWADCSDDIPIEGISVLAIAIEIKAYPAEEQTASDEFDLFMKVGSTTYQGITLKGFSSGDQEEGIEAFGQIYPTSYGGTEIQMVAAFKAGTSYIPAVSPSNLTLTLASDPTANAAQAIADAADGAVLPLKAKFT